MLQSDIKNMNKRIIFDLFRDHRELTRVDVSKLTRISMPSVMKAVQSLVDAHILLPSGEEDTALGRKPLKLRFNADAISAFGVEYEGDRLAVGLVKMDGTVEAHHCEHVSHQFGRSLAQEIIRIIQLLLKKADISNRRIAGLGIGIPGVVDPDRKIIHFAPLIGLDQPTDASPVMQILEDALHWPVFLENDVNTLAIGEMQTRRHRAQACPNDLVFISLGTGLGAGVILNGGLRRGCRFLCGEIGYYSATANGFTSTRDQGWLESQLNMTALKKKFNFSLTEPIPDSRVIDHIVCHLAPAITNLVTLLDIEMIVIGGLLIDALGTTLVQALSDEVNRLALNPVVLQHHLCEEPGIVGAAAMVIDQRLADLV